MEAAVNIKDAGKTHFPPLVFLKKYLSSLAYVHNGQFTMQALSLEGYHCQVHKFSVEVHENIANSHN